jgi:hypothetical protein
MIRRLLSLVLAVGMLAPACTWSELVDVIEGSGESSDLADPENESDVQAAGGTARASDEERAVRELLDEALEEHDVGKVTAARALRPYDPRLPILEAAFEIAGGGTGWPNIREGVALVKAHHPEASEREATRLFTELFLDALRKTLFSYEAGTRQRLTLLNVYCHELGNYQREYQGDAGGVLYLATSVNLNLCS